MLLQSEQLQPSQKSSAAKHSQYNLRHFDFLQLHGFLLPFEPGVEFSFPPAGVLTGVGPGPPFGGIEYRADKPEPGVLGLFGAFPENAGVLGGWEPGG